VQCFNKHTWDNVIRKTPTSTRGYRIALAIEFSDYVMAFLSIDQLIQVLYSFFKRLENSLTNFLALVGCWWKRVTFATPRRLFFVSRISHWGIKLDPRTLDIRPIVLCMRSDTQTRKRSVWRSWCLHHLRVILWCRNVSSFNLGIYLLKYISLAGLSPFLTEAEVFNCPSRTARLCDAFWAYAHKSHNELL